MAESGDSPCVLLYMSYLHRIRKYRCTYVYMHACMLMSMHICVYTVRVRVCLCARARARVSFCVWCGVVCVSGRARARACIRRKHTHLSGDDGGVRVMVLRAMSVESLLLAEALELVFVDTTGVVDALPGPVGASSEPV